MRHSLSLIHLLIVNYKINLYGTMAQHLTTNVIRAYLTQDSALISPHMHYINCTGSLCTCRGHTMSANNLFIHACLVIIAGCTGARVLNCLVRSLMILRKISVHHLALDIKLQKADMVASPQHHAILFDIGAILFYHFEK